MASVSPQMASTTSSASPGSRWDRQYQCMPCCLPPSTIDGGTGRAGAAGCRRSAGRCGAGRDRPPALGRVAGPHRHHPQDRPAVLLGRHQRPRRGSRAKKAMPIPVWLTIPEGAASPTAGWPGPARPAGRRRRLGRRGPPGRPGPPSSATGRSSARRPPPRARPRHGRRPGPAPPGEARPGSSSFELVGAGRAWQDRSMRSSDGYCPVAKSVELLGDRWCLLLVREMVRGVDRFNELERSVPGISRSVLAQRLRHLEREGVVDRRVGAAGRTTDYRLTAAGGELGAVVGALNDWGVRWRVPDGGPPDLDPDGLMLWVRRQVVLGELPARRVVIGFRLRARGRRSYWLVLQPGEVSLCPKHPGFEEDLWVTTDATTLYLVFLGRIGLSAAMGDGRLRVDAAVAGPVPTALVPPASLSDGPAQERGRSRQNSLPSGSRRTCQ